MLAILSRSSTWGASTRRKDHAPPPLRAWAGPVKRPIASTVLAYDLVVLPKRLGRSPVGAITPSLSRPPCFPDQLEPPTPSQRQPRLVTTSPPALNVPATTPVPRQAAHGTPWRRLVCGRSTTPQALLHSVYSPRRRRASSDTEDPMSRRPQHQQPTGAVPRGSDLYIPASTHQIHASHDHARIPNSFKDLTNVAPNICEQRSPNQHIDPHQPHPSQTIAMLHVLKPDTDHHTRESADNSPGHSKLTPMTYFERISGANLSVPNPHWTDT